jgi:hypothetical protein
MKVRGRFREGICQVWVHCFDGGGAGPGGVHLCQRVSGANTAGFGWEANEVRWAGLRDHERRTF